MRVTNKTSKPKGAAAGSGKKKGERVVPVSLPPVKKAAPLMDDSELAKGGVLKPLKQGRIVGENANDRGEAIPKKKAPVPMDLEAELGVTVASQEELANLSKEVGKAVSLTETIEGLEEMVKAHKAELHTLTNRTIPDIMRAAHTSLFKMDNGARVELKDFMNGSLPKEPELRKEALTWLEKNGAKDLIKTNISLALGRGQKDDALAVRKALGKLGMTFIEKEDVHAQSLYAYARERMKTGKELPIETLGLYVGQVAKIELPDKSAG